MDTINQRHPLDVAQILKEYGGQFVNSHNLCPDQLKAYSAILHCRTPAMGGHLQACDQYGHQRIAYNSCCNRHGNKCQLKWVDQLQTRLPVCSYFHMVFTLPAALHKIFYINQRSCYNLFFKVVAQTLQKVARNPDFLGIETGGSSRVAYPGHSPVIHMIIPTGGLSANGMEWIRSGKKFFPPVKVLSKVSRGVMWSLLEKQIKTANIHLPEGLEISQLKTKVYKKNRNVYTKHSLADPQSVVRYPGRYTHRVAISNNRIRKIKNGQVTLLMEKLQSKPENTIAYPQRTGVYRQVLSPHTSPEVLQNPILRLTGSCQWC